MTGGFVIWQGEGVCNAAFTDMKLQQTILESYKIVVEINGKTKQEWQNVLEWQIIYHDILVLSNWLQELTK